MAKNNFYVVKKGHETGIFTSWAECQDATNGYSSPVYRGFVTKEEAEAYWADKDIYLDQIKKDLADGFVVAYTDGSFDENTKRYAYGVCIFDSDGTQIELSGTNNFEPFDKSQNIAGEIFAVLTALDWAISNEHEKIKIYHDLESVAKWAKGEFQAKSAIAQFYVKKLQDKYNGCIEYVFEKVAGHSNNPYNDRADALAAGAIRGDRKMIQGANSFIVVNFDKTELEAILQLITEEDENIRKEEKDILGGKQYKISVGKMYVVLKMYTNKKLLVQGKPTTLYQIVLTYISELLGEKKIVSLIKEAYRVKIDEEALENNYEVLCPNLPTTYNANVITLIRQAIINLNGYFQAAEYSQYAFPVLRALEGHIKYLFDKFNVHVGNKFDQFDGDPLRGHSLRTEYGIKSPYSENIEACYNYYCKTRHKVFHFGEVMGATDNTHMITSKREVDDIIQQALVLINNTVY